MKVSYSYMTHPKVVPVKNNNLEFRLVEVEHTKSYFNKYKVFFNKEVNEAGALCIEGSDTLNHEFVKPIMDLAKEKQIAVYFPDRTDSKHWLMDMVQLLIGLGIISRGCIIPLMNSYLKNEKSSRRQFLKRILAGISGAYLTYGTFMGPGPVINSTINKDIKIDDLLIYGTIDDYRNLLNAENLDRLSTEINLEKPISCFYGYLHPKGIYTYLTNPKLRKKRVVYLPQDLLTNTNIRRYEFIDNSWKMVKEF